MRASLRFSATARYDCAEQLTLPEFGDRFEEMDLAYFKRFRMEIDLSGRDLTPAPAPSHYRFVPWQASLLDAFARAKFLSFRGEFDTAVFPCLADFDGCRRLMNEIAEKPGFLPEATWLVVRLPFFGGAKGDSPIFADTKIGTVPATTRPEFCGTVQGVCDRRGVGAIQNIGVVDKHRRNGLGMGLLLRALAGFRQSGVHRVYLEVTAQNGDAIRLYRRAGFTTVKVVYKAAEAEYAK
jgi:ribosomal protein S18 acetylase RimI-like enzyme